VAEFFPSFLSAASDGGRAWGLYPWPAEQLVQARVAEEEKLRQQALGQIPLEPVAAAVGEAAMAMDIIAAMVDAGPAGARPGMSFTASLPNEGQVPNLPRDLVVEMPALAGGGTIRGLPAGELPSGIAAVCAARLAQQELVVEAALKGDRQVALQALLADPLVWSLTTAQAGEMLDRLLAAHERYLPQFA
jgi:alpha-galactosidase